MHVFQGFRAGRSVRYSVGLALTALLAVAAVQAQQPLVLYITAVDGTGAPVADLKAEEIAAAEKGAPAKVVSFEKAPLPVRLTIVVDNNSDSASVLGYYREGLNALVKSLPPELEVSLFTMAPQPRQILRPTADQEEILRGIGRFGPDDQPSRFGEMLVEFAESVEKDTKDKKLTYAPYLLILSTSAAPATSAQRGEIEKAMGIIANNGVRVSMAITPTRVGDTAALAEMTDTLQGVVGSQLAKGTRGRFEALASPQRLQELLPEMGADIANSHKRQMNRFRATIERPAGATNDLSGFNIGITREGVKGAVSLDGRF